MQKSRIIFTSLCVAALALTAGCSSLNPFAKKPSTRNQPVALVDFKQTLPVHTLWSASVGKAGKYIFTPALVGNDIYTAAANGTITKLDASSGRTVWQIDAGMDLTAGVGSDGDTIVVSGVNGQILAFDNQGKLRWKAQASSEVLSAPAVGQGVVVVRSLDNRVIGLDAESGTRKWSLQRTTPSLSLRTAPGITIAKGAAYVGLSGGRLLALALNNGAPRWEVPVGDPRGTTDLERIADISGTPVVAGRDVCAVSYQGRVACVDAVSGQGLWWKSFSSDVGVAVDERAVYASDERGALSAFSRNGGASLWRNNQLANRSLSTPAASGAVVAVGDYQGYVHFFSKQDGLMLARVATDGSPILAAPLVARGKFIFQTQSGTVVAIATE
jgi:outer membrane protein assembly factor BamB